MGYETAVRFRDGGDRLELAAGSELDLGGTVWWMDDFLGDALDARYDLASGSDAQAVDPTINAAVGGTARLTTGNSNANVAADASALGQELTWQADQGGLVMEARLKMDVITNVEVYVGLTDAKPSGTLEMPFTVGSSDALTSNASDAAGFVFDTGADTDNWFAAGVANDTDATGAPVDSGTAPTAATYQIFKIRIDASGNADFFLDDTFVTNLSSAVTAATALTPVVVANSTTTTSRNIDVDYLWLQMDR